MRFGKIIKTVRRGGKRNGVGRWERRRGVDALCAPQRCRDIIVDIIITLLNKDFGPWRITPRFAALLRQGPWWGSLCPDFGPIMTEHEAIYGFGRIAAQHDMTTDFGPSDSKKTYEMVRVL